jgi:23S rRNA (cytidine1920-2'-O)/16S rRNA (cytidine1409-2'-O)-methyltransferase
VLPAILQAAPGAELVLLVKPQFEVGRERVGKGGVVRDPVAWRDAMEGVARALTELEYQIRSSCCTRRPAGPRMTVPFSTS